MVLISIIVTLLYLLLIGSFVIGFDKIPVFKLKDLKSKTTFSVIIPFRNEAGNLPNLLASIDALEYPNHLHEVIFVDDESDDESVNLIMRFLTNVRNDIKVISNKRASNSPKKDAITTAVKQAKNDWILTTDADCILPKYWLDSFDECIQTTTSKCIVAPVIFHVKSGFLNRFQLLDMLSLQGATMGGFGIKKPFLCNGANFAYQKELFETLNGFDGNKNIASGDDIFLLEKAVKKHPENVTYLKCEQAIVTTNAQPNWKALKAQRIRWAAKTSAYNNLFGKLTGVMVFLINALIISLLPWVLLKVLSIKIFVYLLIIKFSIDYLLIFKSASFFNQKQVLSTYIFGFLLYPFFSVYIALISLFKGYKWKGRDFKK
ncbi:glycosyltransferase family 2 protein [Hwangdonia lutea]|uniref:Glycosyltransferase n=1 Tax=Hwangdonia lutea TaxID=3075823 RepID=A0AA97ER19_9FLAO|nr:glycosyltransferase [Hwangdonia sp. SCSIO 19198]WOD44635.1 glycosyltransferase [Hwangdonia sp. SCSIO 19198]